MEITIKDLDVILANRVYPLKELVLITLRILEKLIIDAIIKEFWKKEKEIIHI